MSQNIIIKSVPKKILMLLVLLVLQSCTSTSVLKRQSSYSLIESSIATAHSAIKDNVTNCEAITRQFIKRIKVYDKSTSLNSIILINNNAVNRSKTLDTEYQKTKQLRALHCIPVILKDNFDTEDMPTQAGSIALKGSLPKDDAFMVKRLREAGAIIIAKSNMGEWAFSPYNTISSTLGETRNAYNLEHVPAGSSGGTASAIAASFGIIGMGTDTGNSIRGPASHLALVGIRSTMGLTSRDGVVPLVLNRDIAGPLTRSVADAAKTFNVIAGYDLADPITHNVYAKKKVDYTLYLNKESLKGVRLGVIREMFESELADFEVLDLMEQAIRDLKAAGAIIVDPVSIKGFKKLSEATGFCSRFRFDLNNYLKNSATDSTPIKSFQNIVDQALFSERNLENIQWAASVTIAPQKMQPPCIDVQGDPRRRQFLDAVVNAMNAQNVDALIYPSWSNPPRKIADSNSPHGNNSPVIAPHTGQPAITVPMGYTQGNLPAGLQFLARPYDDARLFGYAFAYEQQTQHRKPPALFPAIKIPQSH